MNEEMPVGANRMRFCFFILHSAFIICIFEPCKPMSGKPTVATVPPRFTVRLAQWAAAQTARPPSTKPDHWPRPYSRDFQTEQGEIHFRAWQRFLNGQTCFRFGFLGEGWNGKNN
jgi:hypothetical protein